VIKERYKESTWKKMNRKLIFGKLEKKKEVLGDRRMEKVSLKEIELEKKLVKKEVCNTKLNLMQQQQNCLN
jgi:hypothetical protein